jgi:hypothetical protein
MGWYKNRYNKKSAKKYGWEPSWFKADGFDNKLTENIKEFQERHGLKQDGLCGPTTFRRITLQREGSRQVNRRPLRARPDTGDNHIICNGERLAIDWKTVSIHDDKNYALPDSCYRNYKPHKRNVKMIITHFDVCLSAASCKKVLQKKGISSHFSIDNDGTIYQMVDPQHEAWHAGKRAVNRAAIGIDISNAYYTKYQSWYRRKGHGNRPVLRDVEVHGRKLKECLGFYPKQIEAYKVLVKTLCEYYGIPLKMPMDSSGKVLRAVDRSVLRGKFNGIANHFHVTRGKIDTANLDWDQVLSDLNN